MGESVDVAGELGRVLGRRVTEVLRDVVGPWDFAGCEQGLLGRLARPETRVQFCMVGHLGNEVIREPVVRSLLGRSRDWDESLPLQGCQVYRGVERLALLDERYSCLALCGMDLSRPVSPFFPLFRGEDVMMNMLQKRVHGWSVSALLPLVALHDAVDERPGHAVLDEVLAHWSPWKEEWQQSLLFFSGVLPRDVPGQTLESVGAVFVNMATWSESMLAEMLEQTRWLEGADWLRRIEMALDDARTEPWRRVALEKYGCDWESCCYKRRAVRGWGRCWSIKRVGNVMGSCCRTGAGSGRRHWR
ncbi:MAG: hypothetical protein HC904_13275 [Blastochloris sp.]|nr:hypothetical protein [Blastochloris sp.]